MDHTGFESMVRLAFGSRDLTPRDPCGWVKLPDRDMTGRGLVHFVPEDQVSSSFIAGHQRSHSLSVITDSILVFTCYLVRSNR